MTLTPHGDTVDVYVNDAYQGNPLWHGQLDKSPTRAQLAELAHGASQNGFDVKEVLLPLKKLRPARHER